MTDAIIVLGMHRSGTSCLTGCLRSFGLHLGSVSDYNKYNQKGNQENKEVFRLNEAILKFNSGSWSAPPMQALTINYELEQRRDQVIKDYQKLPKPWGIKDPRMLLTYSFWAKHLPQHSFIGTFRHPKAVAQSLAARDRLSIPLDQGYQLWDIYNKQLLKMIKAHQFPLIKFDTTPEEYLNKVSKAAALSGLIASSKHGFFDANLITQDHYTFEDCPDEVKDTYSELLALS